ncbi:hypothetical protein ACFLZI_03550 [Nitrospirota bacterium]
MINYSSSEFNNKIAWLQREGKLDDAISEVKRAISELQEERENDNICYLFSQLSRLYIIKGESEQAEFILNECEALYPSSILAKYLHLQTIYWQLRDYSKAIAKAEEAIMLKNKDNNIYNKCLNIKGLAHFELGQFDLAAEILGSLQYYDLQLVERLVSKKVELETCMDFLKGALNRCQELKRKGENMTEHISKINSLVDQIEIL